MLKQPRNKQSSLPPPLSPSKQITADNVRHSGGPMVAGKLVEVFRRSTSNQLQCSMFCGGRKCKYESGDTWSDKDKALPIIYSNWITDDLLAMSRPNTRMVEQLGLIDYFKQFNIQTVINLQQPGEHANCGPPLESSGFTYEPKVFMDNENFSVISLTCLIDMVKVLSFALLQGKVAVHCHAGLGRTGTLIAAYLIYAYRCKAQDAIKFVRSRRPNSIQTRNQIIVLFRFANHIAPCFVVYRQVSTMSVRMTLRDFLQRQNILLHGQELRLLRYIPKIVFVICQKLIYLSTETTEDLEMDNFTISYLSRKSYDHVRTLIGQNDENVSVEQEPDPGGLDDNLIDSLVGLETGTPTALQEVIDPNHLVQHRSSFIFDNDEFMEKIPGQKVQVSREEIIKTLIDPERNDPQFIAKIHDYQKEINNRPSGWDRLRKETDISILCVLLLSWFEHFDIPILSDQLIQTLGFNDNLKRFHDLDQETKFTLEYLARFLLKLCSGQDQKLTDKLMARTIASMAKKRIIFNQGEIIPSGRPLWPLLEDGDLVANFFKKLMELIILDAGETE